LCTRLQTRFVEEVVHLHQLLGVRPAIITHCAHGDI